MSLPRFSVPVLIYASILVAATPSNVLLPAWAAHCPPGYDHDVDDSAICAPIPGEPAPNQPSLVPGEPAPNQPSLVPDGQNPSAVDNNFQLPFDLPAVTSPEPIADVFPLIVLASIVVIGGIALGRYSKNRNRGRRIRIPPSAVVDIHTKGGTRE